MKADRYNVCNFVWIEHPILHRNRVGRSRWLRYRRLLSVVGVAEGDRIVGRETGKLDVELLTR